MSAMEQQPSHENKLPSSERREDESSVRFVTGTISTKPMSRPLKPLTQISSSFFQEQNSDSEAKKKGLFLTGGIRVSTTGEQLLLPLPPTVSILDATAKIISELSRDEGTDRCDAVMARKIFPTNKMPSAIDATPRVIVLPRKKKARTARSNSSVGSVLNDEQPPSVKTPLHMLSNVLTHQLPQPIQNPLKTPSRVHSLPRQRPSLSLSAFRKPEAAVRLTDVDPERSIQNFYNIYGGQSRVLGHGASSTVRLATRRSDGSEVAVKSIAKHNILFSRRGRHRFHRKKMLDEWELLKTLQGEPHIVGMLDVFETDEDVHLVLEYCAGGELFDAIQRKKQESKRSSGYTESQAAHIVSQLLHALEMLHRKGIVHRDVKPENVLLVSDDEDLRVKLSDFGLARVLRSSPVAQSISTIDFSSETSSSDDSSCEDSPLSYPTALRHRAYSCVGSDTYVAPEVMSGSGYDTAVDIYSLGVTLYILLCGFSPDLPDVKEEDKHDFKSLYEGAPLDFSSSNWNSISDQAKDLVKKMMEPDPTLRLTAEEALKHEWLAPKHSHVTVRGPSNVHYLHVNFKSDFFQDKVTPNQNRRRKRRLSVYDSNAFKPLRDDAAKSPPTPPFADMSEGVNYPFSGAMAISMADLYRRMSQIAAGANIAASGICTVD